MISLRHMDTTMNLNLYDYLVFCDESSKQTKDGNQFFTFGSILTTPNRYEQIKRNVDSAGLDHLRHEGEFKGKHLGYKGKVILNAAFRQKDRATLSCNIDFGQEGIEPILYLAYALGAEFTDQFYGTDTPDFRRYMISKVKDAIPLPQLKEMYKGIHSSKPSKILQGFRQLADAWRSFDADTTLGSLARSIDQTFNEGKETNLLKFGDKRGGFYDRWGHQMLQGLVRQFEERTMWAGKKVLVIHDRLDKAEAIYEEHGFPLELSRTSLEFVDSRDELGVQLVDLCAWISGNAHFDNNIDHQVWLRRRFAGKFATSKFDLKSIEDFDLSGVAKR